MRTCPNCGAELRDKRVCGECGYDASVDYARFPTITPKINESLSFPDSAWEPVSGGDGSVPRGPLASKKRKGTSKKLALILVGSIAAILLLALILLPFIRGWTLRNGVLTVKTEAAMKMHFWLGRRNKIVRVVVEEGITSVADHAFNNCAKLTSVKLPNSVKTIHSGAFEGCVSLVSINLPKNLTSIESYAFFDCGKLTSIELPSGVRTIGSAAFSRCSSLSSVTLPDGLTIIGDSAFYGCAFTSLVLPDGVSRIGAAAFGDCVSLESITIPDGVNRIEQLAFQGCRSLTEIRLPAGLKEVGISAFSGCDALSVAVFPGTLVQWDTISYWRGNDELLAALVIEVGDDSGIGSRTVTLKISGQGGKTSKVVLHTDAEYLLEALLENNDLVFGVQSVYRFNITAVNLPYGDREWVFTRNGEPVETSADQTPIEDGQVYEFTYRKN